MKFVAAGGDDVRPLSLIAGEISTGKTTVLEFIDYCLGATSHPQHDEVMVNVRTAQLAVEIRESLAEGDQQGDATVAATRYVLERPVGGASKRAWLYRGDENGLNGDPVQSFSLDPSAEDSLSQFLLRASGLSGIRLKDAPTQEESKTSVLSFRDLKPLWFLTNPRIGSEDLVLEKNPHKALKLRQVVDYIFGVNDELTSLLASQIEELRAEVREAQATASALRQFLLDAGFENIDTIDEQIDSIRIDLAGARAVLRGFDERLVASTGFATRARSAFHEASLTARKLEGELRQHTTLALRLEPLRAQYSDDILKMELLEEGARLFDPLSVSHCPACQSLISAPTVVGENCSLCNSVVSKTTDASGDEDAAFLAKEHWNLKSRLRQLNQFAEEVQARVRSSERALADAQRRLEQSQLALDQATTATVSPFISERDAASSAVSATEARLTEARQTKRMFRQLVQRENQASQAAASLKQALEWQRSRGQTQQPRDAVLGQVASRLESILKDFGYPKLSAVSVAKTLIPSVRGHRYTSVGSAGAMTLISLAWQLAIFELALESGTGHPGFLMIDSPQKNLKPASDEAIAPASNAAGVDDDLTPHRASIVNNIYAHIESWLARGYAAQIIIVDNEPPLRFRTHEVVRYSADPDDPPYGLISDADGSDSDWGKSGE